MKALKNFGRRSKSVRDDVRSDPGFISDRILKTPGRVEQEMELSRPQTEDRAAMVVRHQSKIQPEEQTEETPPPGDGQGAGTTQPSGTGARHMRQSEIQPEGTPPPETANGHAAGSPTRPLESGLLWTSLSRVPPGYDMFFVEPNWWERDLMKLNMTDSPLYTFKQFLEKDFERRHGTFIVNHTRLESVVGEGGGGSEGVGSLLRRSNSPSLKVLPCSVVINVKCLRVISHMDRAYILVDERKSLKVVDDSFSSERKSLKAIDIFRQALIDKHKSADSDEQSSLFPVQVVQAVVDTVLERCETKYEVLYDFFKPFTCLRQREKSVNEVRTMEKISQKLESLENLLSKVKAMIGMLRKNRDLASCEEGRTMLKVITVDFEVQLNRFLTFEEKTEKLLRFATKLNDAMEHSNRARQAVLGTETLKFLQIPGLAFIVPTLIAGVLGMNLNTSFADSKDAFYITVLLFLVIAAWVAMFQLFRKKRLA